MNKKYCLGFDLDGVLADFIRGAYGILNEINPRIKDTSEEPHTWNFPEEQFGYTAAEWKECRERYWASETFWFTLQPMFECEQALTVLTQAYAEGHHVYFITDRAGKRVHEQTVMWLVKNGYALMPQVLLTKAGTKGHAAKTLQLTHFIDDKPENCYDVREASPQTKVFLFRRRWNDYPEVRANCQSRGITIVSSIREFFEALAEEEKVNAIVV